MIDVTQLKAISHNSKSIVDLFRRQVQMQGSNTAIVYKDRCVTYQQLEGKSLGIALYLQQRGVSLDECVGLFVEPSIELMEGVWGILQSGAAYLPLSPEYPDDRLKYMLENSRCKIIVVQDHLVNRLSALVEGQMALERVEFISFSQVEMFYRGQPKLEYNMLSYRAEPHNLAYVIYTSGSTGKPKGVMIEHRSIVNQMEWLETQFSLSNNNVILQKTPMSFDAAQWEILATSCGAQVVIGESGTYKNPEKLVSTIVRYGVTILQGVPTLLHALLDVEQFSECKTLKQIFSGGEALSKHLAIELSESLPHCRIVNLYGPTECTINSSAYIVDMNSLGEGPDTISIGVPIQNTSYYILDDNKKPVAVGTVGELYVGGIGLARGYLHRKDLTSERFIKCGFSDENIEQTLYKTGDLAYWNTDKTVQYVGRVDNQVKLRGYRVELDEIKARIETHDWVNSAAVFLKNDQHTGYQNLIAVIELNPREAALMDQGNQEVHHQSKQSRSQVKMQLTNSGCRDTVGDVNKAIFELPGKLATKKQYDLVFSRKSYRFFDGGKASKAGILDVLNHKIHYSNYSVLADLSYENFGRILRYFGQYLSDDRLLPKYGYASPGALYATQMYFELHGFDNLVSGFYYYHPVNHQLILMNKNSDINTYDNIDIYPKKTSEVKCKVHFIGKKSAIEPIYKNNILEVLEMEVGHMVGLFENILPEYGLSIEDDKYVPEVLQLLHVAKQDYYLGSFNITSGKKEAMDEAVDIYVQAHPGKVEGLNAGKYQYHNKQLVKISDDIILKKHVIAINQSVYERSSFGISILSNTDKTWLDYINLGRKLQTLQMNDLDIGFMSSGYSSKSGHNLPSAKRIQHILEKNTSKIGADPSYFFLGGCISQQQKNSRGMNEDVVHMKGPSEIIQDDLVNFLPSYMMPNKIDVIDKMPLTANGKIDIKALKLINIQTESEEYVKPSNNVEREVLELWKKGLKRDSISVKANFFELGGNSLIAVSLINKINTKLQCELPLQVLFNSPTIEKLAQAIYTQSKYTVSRLVPLQAKGNGSPVYCWPGLGGYCMNLRLLAEKVSTDRSFFGVQAYGINAGEKPYSTIKEMAAQDVSMIKKHQSEGPYTLWGYSFGARVAFEACYQLEQAGDIVDNLYLIAPGSPRVHDEGAVQENAMYGRTLRDECFHNEGMAFNNKKFITILYSVFMGTIKGSKMNECLATVGSREEFITFVCRLNDQLSADLVARITDIVMMTFEFTYSFDELKQRQLNAPIKIIKATGDDYSFIENHDAFSTLEPVVEEIEANHYSMLKTSHIDQLVAVL